MREGREVTPLHATGWGNPGLSVDYRLPTIPKDQADWPYVSRGNRMCLIFQFLLAKTMLSQSDNFRGSHGASNSAFLALGRHQRAFVIFLSNHVPRAAMSGSCMLLEFRDGGVTGMLSTAHSSCAANQTRSNRAGGCLRLTFTGQVSMRLLAHNVQAASLTLRGVKRS